MRHDLHQALHRNGETAEGDSATVSRCSTRHWAARTAEHYLLMLSSVLSWNRTAVPRPSPPSTRISPARNLHRILNRPWEGDRCLPESANDDGHIAWI